MLCSPDGSNEKDSGEICAKDEDTGISIRNVLKKFRSTLNAKTLSLSKVAFDCDLFDCSPLLLAKYELELCFAVKTVTFLLLFCELINICYVFFKKIVFLSAYFLFNIDGLTSEYYFVG